ncbi:DNA-binding CsgD family transcriptional regulator [Agrobacterium tumefaciens]|uniref:autoinducer binding domain-containing protein n=1 Tax=Agrobacterium tumefaciens TaxID=358 RepID=UPI000DD0AD21|nr:autoinducer binding domain-containing protein [Agrobacterium tumefaciens]MBP2510211.1 DNA-binding CsgD family transcriptional regulator [Agrobacterium tumefaciens]MBP2519210.1 DNA-binding CsgD family transcriptional regulator [Agrobacterium tumefaciens]MBP2577064.1 DNA-binding CsgD family transcriptional regulator [Agrobacterium tumefaciens]MBP2596567.1 DNA-binding CsgD family transcriptional regulator [Agrobacterium tumefaciens]MDP9857915.1 DNA-binding CsgD family transcriptional regulator
MKLWLHKLIDTTSMMKTSRATAELLDHLTQELGFEYYHALTVRHPGFRSSILSNAPEAWLDQYRQEHFDWIDPILDRTREIMAPFVFDFEHEGKVARGPHQTFYSSADGAGIRAGICMPVMAPFSDLFTLSLFTGDVTLPHKYRLQPALSANAVALLQMCVEATAAASIRSPAIELTARQSMVLKWAAEGKTTQEIALLENMTHHTVNFHMKNIRRKLKTVTLPQTTALATKLGLI